MQVSRGSARASQLQRGSERPRARAAAHMRLAAVGGGVQESRERAGDGAGCWGAAAVRQTLPRACLPAQAAAHASRRSCIRCARREINQELAARTRYVSSANEKV